MPPPPSTPSSFRFARPKSDGPPSRRSTGVEAASIDPDLTAKSRPKGGLGGQKDGPFKTIIGGDEGRRRLESTRESLIPGQEKHGVSETRRPGDVSWPSLAGRPERRDKDREMDDLTSLHGTQRPVYRTSVSGLADVEGGDSTHDAKRPRLDATHYYRATSLTASAFTTPAKGQQPQQHTTTAPAFKGTPHFLSSSPSQSGPAAAAAYRPRFAAAPEQQSVVDTSSLPLAFSPHRRRQKERFVPGGWASQMRGWVFDAVADAPLASPDASVHTVVRIDDLKTTRGEGNADPCAVVHGHVHRASGPSLAPSSTLSAVTDQPAIRVVLVGHGEGRNAQDSLGRGLADTPEAEVKVGMLIRLGPPIWEMDLPFHHTTGGTAEDDDTMTTWLVCAGWKRIHDDL